MPGKRRPTVLAAILAIVPVTFAAAEDSYTELSSAYMEAAQTWYESAQKGDQLDWSTNPVTEYFPRMKELAERLGDSVEAADPLVWIVQNARQFSYASKDDTSEVLNWALNGMHRSLAGHDAKTKELLPQLQYLYYDSIEVDQLATFYEGLIAASTDRQMIAQAKFNLAAALYSEFATRPGDDGARLESDQNRAKDIFLAIAQDYGDTPAAALVKPYIYEINHLQVGMKAPDIMGADADGEEIKLLQFHGQVVVLDFWGFW